MCGRTWLYQTLKSFEVRLHLGSERPLPHHRRIRSPSVTRALAPFLFPRGSLYTYLTAETALKLHPVIAFAAHDLRDEDLLAIRFIWRLEQRVAKASCYGEIAGYMKCVLSIKFNFVAAEVARQRGSFRYYLGLLV